VSAQSHKIVNIAGESSNGLGPSIQERMAQGRLLRMKIPRSDQSKLPLSAHRNPIEALRNSDHGRLPDLLPIKYGRMQQSPFAFFRGSAGLMAQDLARTPRTGISVQVCGDCHAANFGGFASPERRLLFDINDFDETLRAAWEWDLKRLAASVVLASRELGLKEAACSDAVLKLAQSYRQHIREYARMRALEIWYSHMDAEVFVRKAKTSAAKEHWEDVERKARLQTAEHIFPKMANVVNGRTQIVDHPPLIYHRESVRNHATEMFHRYRETLPAERRIILDRYHIVDVAQKVVGVGSVGTRCAVILLMAGEHDPMLLQIKEAMPSVLEPYAGQSRYRNHGERIVTGQRMLQSASDVFLGWTQDAKGRDYYFRQLRDMKMKIELDLMSKAEWLEYIEICGWTLARAHARTGDAAVIGGYIGRNDRLDRALTEFATLYADQTERDHTALIKAIRSGVLNAQTSQ
jgi:uncharacterized protein (DUF2252 family)